jgi:hypothetical protein
LVVVAEVLAEEEVQMIPPVAVQAADNLGQQAAVQALLGKVILVVLVK